MLLHGDQHAAALHGAECGDTVCGGAAAGLADDPGGHGDGVDDRGRGVGHGRVAGRDGGAGRRGRPQQARARFRAHVACAALGPHGRVHARPAPQCAVVGVAGGECGRHGGGGRVELSVEGVEADELWECGRQGAICPGERGV